MDTTVIIMTVVMLAIIVVPFIYISLKGDDDKNETNEKYESTDK